MAAPKGAPGGASDTDFRRTWDRDEYAARAAEREGRMRDEGRARREAALAGRKYRAAPAGAPPEAHDTEARRQRLDVAALVGTTQMVAAAAAGPGRRGRGAGFYCDACDLTFKDNLQLVEHLNSKLHLVATGESGQVRRATLEEVVQRFAYLQRTREEEEARDAADLHTRIGVAAAREEREREERRRKRNERRRKTKDGLGHPEVKVEGDGVIC